MLHKAWKSKGEMPYRFPRSSVKFQGHTVQNITDFDPNWAFPDYRPVTAFKSLRFALFWQSLSISIWQLTVLLSESDAGIYVPLKWRHNEHDGVSNHQPYDCLLNRFYRRRSKKTSKLRVTGLYEGNSPMTGDFPSQKASNTENVSIWWRHMTFACVLHQLMSYQVTLVQGLLFPLTN